MAVEGMHAIPSLRVIQGSRGRPELVTQRRTAALSPVLEAIALADDAIGACHRIYNAELARDVPSAVVAHEAARLAIRATRTRSEMKHLAGVLDPA